MVYGYARKRGLQDADAADVTQLVLRRLAGRMNSFDYDARRGSFRGWLFTVAYHQAMLSKRRQKSKTASARSLFTEGEGAGDMLPDGRDGPTTEAEQREEAAQLRALLDQLPAHQREVIRQRIYEGKRFREIADELQCPLNTALARMHEGMKRLRTLWEKNHARAE